MFVNRILNFVVVDRVVSQIVLNNLKKQQQKNIYSKCFCKKLSFGVCFIVSAILFSFDLKNNMHCCSQCNEEGTKSLFSCSHKNISSQPHSSI